MQGKNECLPVVSLSFNSYSTNGVAAIASKVSDEFSHDDLKNIHENDDFEFSVEFGGDELDLTADDEIQSVFPIFNRDLLQNGDNNVDCVNRRNVSIKIPLDELFIGNCEAHSENSSISSFEGDESAVRTAYCLGRPKFVAESSPAATWKKSRSTGEGSRRRWRLRDLLRRSNSDRKGPFVFPIPKQIEEKIVRSKNGGDSPMMKVRNSVDGERELKAGEASPSRSPLHEVFYLRNRAEKERGKNKSYLPYRRTIFSFLSGFKF